MGTTNIKKMQAQDRFSKFQFFSDWIKRVLPNSQAISLAIILVVGFALIINLSGVLMPVFAAGVLAYLLEGIVSASENKHIPRFAAVVIVFLTFSAFVIFFLIALMPLLYQQIVELVQQLPIMINRAQGEILRLPEIYPTFVSEKQVKEIIVVIRSELITYGQEILSTSVASLVGLITVVVYLILVPLLVFFFLKDKDTIIQWVTQFLPRERHLSTQVWREVDIEIGNYIRGKFLEIFILGIASYVTFTVMGLNYALLLSVLMGLSVIIPYVGATLVTFPVMIVAYFQWGVEQEFIYVMTAYFIMQAIDGVILVPLLFSEVVNLHPIAIIVAILFFGGFWGFWGVFFAIPLATLVQSVLNAWPRIGGDEGGEQSAETSADDTALPDQPIPPANDEAARMDTLQ